MADPQAAAQTAEPQQPAVEAQAQPQAVRSSTPSRDRRPSVAAQKVSEEDYFILDPQDIIVRNEVHQLIQEVKDSFEARVQAMKESFDMQMSTAMSAIGRLTHELQVERERRARIERYVMSSLRSPADELEAIVSGNSPRGPPPALHGSASTGSIHPSSPRGAPVSHAPEASDTVRAVATSPRLRLDLARVTSESAAIAEATASARASTDSHSKDSASGRSLSRTTSTGSISTAGHTRSANTTPRGLGDSPGAVDTSKAADIVRERSGTVIGLQADKQQQHSPTQSPRSRAPSNFSFLPRRNTRVKTSLDAAELAALALTDSQTQASPRTSASATSPPIRREDSTVKKKSSEKDKDKDAEKRSKNRASSVFGTIKKTLFKRGGPKGPAEADDKNAVASRATISGTTAPSRSGVNSLEQLFSSVTQPTPATVDNSANATAPMRFDGAMAEIDFTACELTTLPLQVVNRMDQISGLRLGSNKFTEWPELVSATMHELDLSLNEISVIPPSINKLPFLRNFFIFSNRITKVPNEIAQLVHLQTLDVSRNLLMELPPAIGSLVNLRELVIFGNRLTAIPAEIKNCTALETLDAGENDIRFLPNEICQLTQLRELNLYLNKLSELPEDLGNLVELRELNLAENFLYDMPLSCGKFRYLSESINLSSNRFTDDALRVAIAQGPQDTMAYLQRRLYAVLVPVPSMEGEPSFAPPNSASSSDSAHNSLLDVSTTSTDISPPATISRPPSAGEMVPPSAADARASPRQALNSSGTISQTEDLSESSESMSVSQSVPTSTAGSAAVAPNSAVPSEKEAKKAAVDNKIQVLITWAKQVVAHDLRPELDRLSAGLSQKPSVDVIVNTMAVVECFEKALKRIHQHLPSEFHDSVLDGLLNNLSSNLERKSRASTIPTVEIEQSRQDLQIRILDIRSKLTALNTMLDNRSLGNHTIIDVIMSVKEIKVSVGQISGNNSSAKSGPIAAPTAGARPAH